MPRAPKPRWHAEKRRWVGNVGPPDAQGRATERYAPASIGPRDESAAWEWFRSELAARAAAVAQPPPERLAVEAVLELYLQHAESRANSGQVTAKQYRHQQLHLGLFAGAFAGRPVGSLSPDDVEAWLGGLRARYSGHYVANVAASVMAAFRWAERSRLLPRSPVAGFRAPPVPEAPVRLAERREAAVWLWWLRRRVATARAHHRRSLLLIQWCLIRTGARPGELCALRWDDLTWDAWRAEHGGSGAKAELPPERWKVGKRTGRRRVIYLAPVLARSLGRLRASGAAHPVCVFTHAAGRGGRGGDEPWADGSTLSKTVARVRRELIAWQRATGDSGVSAVDRWAASVPVRDEGPNRLVGYRWRHTAISRLVMDGVDVPTVAKLTGTSVEMIARVYGHLSDAHVARAAGRL